MSSGRLTALSLGAACSLAVASTALAYPTDAYERTGIRRLEWQREVDAGTRHGRKLPPGAQWTGDRIGLHMLSATAFRLSADTPRDPKLQAGLEAILRHPEFRHYGLAVLDITDPAAPRYAAVHETSPLTPGSVAKILVGAALLQGVHDRFPDSTAAREAFLRDTRVTTDEWALPNSHEVPIVDGERVVLRPVRAGDTFSLWEWLDHMLSPSSNGAASMVWREATLMTLLGTEYPPSTYGPELWARWDRQALSEAAFRAIDTPLLGAGLDPQVLTLRLFFTRGAGKHVDRGPSLATPLGLLQWMVAVEQGRMVDDFSSLELKRLLYLTRRRVRYAKAPELLDSAVFFKSGSLWRCTPEPGYTCTAYQGNALNVLNALVEVATPEGLTYIVAVMSNEPKRNSADDHAKLAGYLHRLIQQGHDSPAPDASGATSSAKEAAQGT